MASEQTIVLLGVEGAGKTTYLYRLVTSYLESQGLRRSELDALDAEAFLAEARSRGVTWETGSATEAFLGQAHEAMRDDRDIKLDASEEAVPLALGFTEFDYRIKTAEVPGSLITRTAHLLERGEIHRGDKAVQAYYEYLSRVLRRADGVLFLHSPNEFGREVESEIVLRAFGDLALRRNSRPFLPLVIVFTKAEQWAPAGSTSHMRTAAAAGNQPVMAKRDRFIEAYWQVLVAHHRSDLDHPFWRGITDPYRTGQNFAMIAANKDKFADLRAPLDAVVRLNTLQRTFFSDLRRRNVALATVGLFIFALGVLLALYLPVLFGPNEETRVPDFADAQAIYAWLQEPHDGVELVAALAKVDSNLQVIEPQLRGATGEFTEATFVRYRDFLATLSTFKDRTRALGGGGSVATARAHEIEVRVIDKIAEWMEEQRGDVEAPEELSYRWVAAAERYVDGLAPYLRVADPTRFDDWRRTWQLKQYRDLQNGLQEIREQRRSAQAYVNAARQRLDLAWRYLVEGRNRQGAMLSFLPLTRNDAEYRALSEARRFITQLDEGTLEIEMRIEHFNLPALGEPGDLYGRVLRLEVLGSDSYTNLVTDDRDSRGPRVYSPDREGLLVFPWNVRHAPTVRIVDPRDPSLEAYRLSFEQAVPERSRDDLPLPGFLPSALTEMRDVGSRGRGGQQENRKLRFALAPPAIPELLLYASPH